jgi:integrase
VGKLSAIAVGRANSTGLYADGGGLYLQVGRSGSKSWLYRFMIDGRAREMGLGPVHTIPLAEARIRAGECRRLRLDGIDPIEARTAKRQEQKLASAKAMTFEACANAYIAAHKAGWRNAKHESQWRNTLSTYAAPVFGSLSVQTVDVALVMKVLEPIWATKTETASRLRGRIEAILDWATVRGYRSGENPARWRGHLDHLLPKRAKVQMVAHHAALPYDEVGAFVALLRDQQGATARALEFLILTAARTGEVIGARWAEFDFANAVWTIPADRMKSDREHRIPLSGRVVAIIDGLRATRVNDFVFPGAKAGRPLSNMAMLKVLERLGRSDLTSHGFRSSFRDWASERTNFQREVAEMALAHTIGDKVEAAYRRGDLFAKRRRLMEAWANHCTPTIGESRVVTLRSASPT